ncbi:MAG TPA: MBL fold metallo-hydrolase [Gemmatimonadales bacterium]|nr:MBL fold metallo-hydrolase [Gemmatimonadales bacterium]
MSLHLTYIGGPTLLIEWNGLRLLTDPTFDPAGSAYPTPSYTLHKTQSPAMAPQQLGRVDAVLLSHDHHFDNLDRAGRDLLSSLGRTLTTTAAAERLGAGAHGLAPWDAFQLTGPDGRVLRVVATPARHGPAQGDRGPVIGFVLRWDDEPPPRHAIYVSGDTVWYDGVQEVAQRFSIAAAVLFFGAAKVRAAGDQPLTLTAAEGVEAARAFGPAPIVPVHYEGWEHFSESRQDIEGAFAAAGLSRRLQWLTAGQRTAWQWPPVA